MAEPLNATFFALRARDRTVLVPATLALIVILAVIGAAFVALNWSAISSFAQLFQDADAMGKPMSAELIGPMLVLIGTTFLFLFPLYMAIASYEAACLRWMIRGETPGLFGLTLDNDMWRVYGVYWCWLVLQWVVSMVVSVVTLPMVFATMGEVMANPGDTEAMMRWQLSVQLPLALLQYIPLIFFGIRFGPAAATSVLRRKFSFFDAWKVTRGWFFSLLGSYALLWLVLIVVAVVSFTVVLGPELQRMWPTVLAASSGKTPAQQEVRDVFAAFFTPTGLARLGIAYALNVVVGIAYAILSYGINARAALAALEEGKITPAA